MGFINAGIKELLLAPGGASFPTSEGSGVFGLGIRHEGKMTVEPFNPMTDKNNRQFPNMVNFKIEADTMQVDLTRIANLIARAKAGSISAALISSGVSLADTAITSPNGGIFLFDGANNSLGLDFEISLTQAERVLKLTLERAFKYAYPDGIIDIADSNSLNTVATGVVPNIETAKVISGFINPVSNITNFFSGAETELTAAFADTYLDEFSINVKTKNTKTAFNLSIVSGLDVEISVTTIGADLPAMIKGMKQAFASSDLVLTLDTGKTITFAKEGLSRVGNLEIGDTKRSLTVKYTGSYDLDFVRTTGSAGSETDIKFNVFLT